MTTDALQALLGTGLVPDVTFPPSSRYAGVGITTWAAPPAPGEEEVPVASCGVGWCRSPSGSRRRTSSPASRVTAATTWPPPTSATPSCGGAWPMPTASSTPLG